MTSDDARIAGLTLEERAAELGLSCAAQRELEQREPWVRHWAARFGAAPARWRAWLAAGSPAADLDALCVVGEAPIVAAMRSALARMPRPVQWFVVQHVLVLCGGQESTASCRAYPMQPPAPPAARHLVLLHVADEAVAAHEVGHAFTVDPPAFRSRLTAARCERITAAAVGLTMLKDDLEGFRQQLLRNEQAADALATAWLDLPMDTTTGACGERRREDFEREVARQLERAGAFPVEVS